MKPIKIAGAMLTAALMLIVSASCGEYNKSESFNGAGDRVGLTTDMYLEPVVSSAAEAKRLNESVAFYDSEFELADWKKNENGEGGYSDISMSDGKSDVVRDLSDNGIVIDNAVNEIIINAPGLYRLRGILPAGRIVCRADGDVRIIFDNVSVSCGIGAPLVFGGSGTKVLTLAKGSVNILKNNMLSAADAPSEVGSVIYSESALTVNGGGLLEAGGNADGIVCDDELKINSGTVFVSAKGDASAAKNVAVSGGDVILDSKSGNGMRARSAGADYTDGGNILITGGTVRVTSAYDSVYADRFVKISGDDTRVSVCSGSGSGSMWYDEIYSRKGIRSGGCIAVTGGSLGADSLDNAIDAEAELYIGGSAAVALCSKKSAVKAALAEIGGGRTEIRRAGVGIAAAQVNMTGGAVKINSYGNGLSLITADQQLTGYDCAFILTGGSVDIDADAVGINAYGKILITGGTLCCGGSCDAAAPAVYASEGFKINGGRVMLSASQGMIQTPVTQSAQNSVVLSFRDELPRGALVALKKGRATLFSREIMGCCGSMLFSCPAFETGESFTAEINGTLSESFTIDGRFDEISFDVA